MIYVFFNFILCVLICMCLEIFTCKCDSFHVFVTCPSFECVTCALHVYMYVTCPLKVSVFVRDMGLVRVCDPYKLK